MITTKHSVARLLILCALAAFLGACAEGQSELTSYIDATKKRQGKALPPLPVMKRFESFEYNAHDLRDPFSRVAANRDDDADVAVAQGSGPRPDRNRRKEELESFPLDSLDMVGTMEADNQLFGLIKAPGGIVHRVRPQNYLGQNDGRITAIFEDRIELIELFPNGLGGWEERRSAIALDN